MKIEYGKNLRSLVTFGAAATFIFSGLTPIFTYGQAIAASLMGETFSGISTPADAWISGGSGGSVACLTGATTSAANSIPACPSGPLDTAGNGVLRLTPSSNTRSGFAFYNTPISADHGLNIAFDMYQYNGNGADGISFFLIDGNASPTQPGASGGALGYASSSNGENPGISGGYVGIGFDKFGNYSNSDVGAGGPGASANTIAVRGSEDTNYAYVTGKVAAGSLANTGTTVRANAKRHVVIFISTNNIMTVSVNYNDGQGLRTELSNIDLNTINGEGSLPASFKFGFAASTGGSYDIHEISGITVNTLNPNVGIDIAHSGTFIQGGTAGHYTMTVSNNAGAESTDGTVTAQSILPVGLTPTAAAGTGWDCGIASQTVTCTRSDVLAPGDSFPVITTDVSIATNAAASLTVPATVSISSNDNATPSDSDVTSIAAGSSTDTDGVFDTEEAAAPNSGDANNDGTADALQSDVTSLHNPVTGKYAVLQSSGCTANANVGITAESANVSADGGYEYPAGLMAFGLTCGVAGGTATVTQYYYGTFDSSQMVMRKYDTTTHAYATVAAATFTNVTIGGQAALKVVYLIQDGGPYDQDGLANGTIVDPAGPAVQTAVSTPTPTAASATAAASSTPTPMTAKLPNTGLPTVSVAGYAASLLCGFGLLVFEVRRIRLAKKK